jgi:hypothetical protein
MGTAQNFAVLGGSTVTNTGATVLNGELGVSPGTAITGFPPGIDQNGGIHSADAAAAQAESDASTGYKNLTSQACTVTYTTPTDIGGTTLKAGVYCFASSAQISGTLTLDGQDNPNATWIFKMGSTLTTASGASVQLINGAQECKVFWQVGSSATIGTSTLFTGTILASSSITVGTGASISGRALALNGAVTLDTNKISFSACLHGCYEVTSRVTDTIMIPGPDAGAQGTAGSRKVTGAALSPDGNHVWVAGYRNAAQPGFVSLVNVETHHVDNYLTVGPAPSDITFSWGTRAWVTNSYDATMSQIHVADLKPLALAWVGNGGVQYPFGAAFVNGHMLITNLGESNAVSVYDTKAALTLRKGMAVSGQSGRPSVVSANAAFFAGKILVPVFEKTGSAGTGHPSLNIVDPLTVSIVATISLPSSGAMPQAVVSTPNGHYAYVSLFDSSGGTGGVWVIDLSTLKTKKVINTGDPSNYGEAMSADGTYMLVAGYSKNQVALIYTASNSVDNVIQGGEQPNAIVLASDDSQAFVTNQTNGTVTVISFSPHL